MCNHAYLLRLGVAATKYIDPEGDRCENRLLEPGELLTGRYITI